MNLFSNLLPSGAVASRVRALALNMLGNRISMSARVAGGGYVYGGGLSVGRRAFVGRGVYFDLTAPVSIQDDVVVGHGVTFITAGHEIGPTARRCGAVMARDIVVQSGAWIGANATVMPGVNIGAGSVVGACSVVTKSVPPGCLVVGTPARVIRQLDA